jgi:hypothetical protein
MTAKFVLQSGTYLPQRISDTFRTGEDVAEWLRANGHVVIRIDYNSCFQRVDTADGDSVYRNGWIAGPGPR